MTLLDAGVIAWFVTLLALLVVQQFSTAGARIARLVLVPLMIVLGAAFAWKVVSVFAPIVQFELG